MTDALRDLVRVMDRLRSPGGCPWDADQTHESLVPYALEETYELVEAIETGDRTGLREELGDVLLQVVFHARIAAEDPDDPFDVDDVAADLVAKLVRRHPHVFDEADGPTTDLHVQWDKLKNAEKSRASALDGIPLALGALARAQKVADRAGACRARRAARPGRRRRPREPAARARARGACDRRGRRGCPASDGGGVGARPCGRRSRRPQP